MNLCDYNWTEWWHKRNPFGWKLYCWLVAPGLLNIFRELEIKNMLELGGGSGLVAKILAQKLKVELSLLDNNQGAHEAFLKFSRDGEYLRKDFFSFKTKRKWDLVYSLGVLEHFSKKRKLELIKIHQKLASKYVFIAVPANSWLRFSYSLLRYRSLHKLYSQKQLKQEFKGTSLKLWRSGEDLWWAWVLAKV